VGDTEECRCSLCRIRIAVDYLAGDTAAGCGDCLRAGKAWSGEGGKPHCVASADDCFPRHCATCRESGAQVDGQPFCENLEHEDAGTCPFIIPDFPEVYRHGFNVFILAIRLRLWKIGEFAGGHRHIDWQQLEPQLQKRGISLSEWDLEVIEVCVSVIIQQDNAKAQADKERQELERDQRQQQ